MVATETALRREAETDIGALIDDRIGTDGVFRVAKSVYVDPEIFELEMERIFARVWTFVCHESQIKTVGDYFATQIARQPIFAIRSTENDIKVYFDACSHRGARLTTRRYGRAATITCRYHGWCFNTSGKCIKIPYKNEGWPEGVPSNLSLDLTPVPRVANYRGFIFASLAPNGESLEDFLGEAKRFIDTMVDQSPEGIEVVDGSIRYLMNANWKFQSENGADGYHVASVHRNYADTVVFREQLTADLDPHKATEAGRILNRGKTATGAYDLGMGHMVNWSARVNTAAVPLGEREPALLEAFPEGYVRWMVRRGRVLTMFPNFLINDVASTAIRVWRPVSVDQTELETWCFAPVGESGAAREARLRKFEDFFFPSSLAVPDDVAAMEGAHEGSAAANSMGWVRFSRGMEYMVEGPDAAANDMDLHPVSSNEQGDSETCFFGFYRRWRALMTAEA